MSDLVTRQQAFNSLGRELNYTGFEESGMCLEYSFFKPEDSDLESHISVWEINSPAGRSYFCTYRLIDDGVLSRFMNLEGRSELVEPLLDQSVCQDNLRSDIAQCIRAILNNS